MRVNEIINELFDKQNASFLDWEKSPGVTYANGHVTVGGHNVAIDITFTDMDEGRVELEFMVGGQFDLTGKGGAGPVFATVIEAVKQFVAEHPKVNLFLFSAEEQSRARSYDTLAKRVARDLGWHVVPYEDLTSNKRYHGRGFGYGGFTFAIEKGQAPQHRQAAQKPQHSKFVPIFYVYSREEDLPVYMIRANRASEAERYVVRNTPEYKTANPMGVFATTNAIPGATDLGTVPKPQPKPPERVLTPLEQQLRDKLGA